MARNPAGGGVPGRRANAENWRHQLLRAPQTGAGQDPERAGTQEWRPAAAFQGRSGRPSGVDGRGGGGACGGGLLRRRQRHPVHRHRGAGRGAFRYPAGSGRHGEPAGRRHGGLSGVSGRGGAGVATGQRREGSHGGGIPPCRHPGAPLRGPARRVRRGPHGRAARGAAQRRRARRAGGGRGRDWLRAEKGRGHQGPAIRHAGCRTGGARQRGARHDGDRRAGTEAPGTGTAHRAHLDGGDAEFDRAGRPAAGGAGAGHPDRAARRRHPGSDLRARPAFAGRHGALEDTALRAARISAGGPRRGCAGTGITGSMAKGRPRDRHRKGHGGGAESASREVAYNSRGTAPIRAATVRKRCEVDRVMAITRRQILAGMAAAGAIAAQQQPPDVPLISTSLASGTDPNGQQIVGIAGFMGIPLFRPGYWRYGNAANREVRLAAVQHEILSLASVARAYKIATALHNSSGDCVGAGLTDLNGILRNIDPRWVGYNFDPGFATETAGVDALGGLMELAMPKLKAVTVRDFTWNKEKPDARKPTPCPLGEGIVDWRPFFTALARARFVGPITIEVRYEPKDELNAFRHDLEFVRKQVAATYAAV